MKLNRYLIISLLLLFSLIVFSPLSAKAESIGVTGDWTVSYSINDTNVHDSGGTATVTLNVSNTSSSQTITYVSIDIGAGTTSAFYQIDPILDLRPGTSVTLIYRVPIDSSDVDKSMNFWVAMSQGSSSHVDGIGVTQVVFKGDPYIDFIARLEADRTTVDAGETVRFTINVVNRGDPIEVTYLYNMDDVNLETGAPFTETYTYHTSMRVNETGDIYYKVYGAMVGAHMTQNTNAVRITVREPEASESPTPSASSAETPTPESSAEIVETPIPSLSASPDLEPDTSASEAANSGNIGTIFIYILLGLICAAVVIMLVVLIKSIKPKHKQ